MASQSDLYSLAKTAGLPDHAARTAAAIGMAESGGNPNKHNTKPPDDSYGLWQINMLGDLGPARRRKYGLASNEQLFDPATNARVMRGESSNGLNWYPWSAYGSGAYLKYMSEPVTDHSGEAGWLSKLGSIVNPLSPITDPLSDATKAASSVAQLTIRTAKWVSNSENWVRIGFVAGGTVLVVAGLVMVMSSTKAGRTITDVAGVGTKVVRKVKAG